MAKRGPAKRPDQHVAERVKIARESKRWKQADLAVRLGELGFTHWRQSKVAKVENGEVKRLTLEDVLALAAALEVQPAHLLAGDGDVQIAPKVRRSAVDFRAWVRGNRALGPEAERFYFTGPLVPDHELAAVLVTDREEMTTEARREWLARTYRAIAPEREEEDDG